MPELCLTETLQDLTSEIAILNEHLSLLTKPILDGEKQEDRKVRVLNKFMCGVEE